MKIIARFRALFLTTEEDKRSIIIRLIIGLIFLSEGIQKYLFPELTGTGRFVKIGFADPEFWAYFTATFEIVCGILYGGGKWSLDSIFFKPHKA